MKYGTRVRCTVEALGVLNPESPRPAFLPDAYVHEGDEGIVTVPGGSLPDGWLMVSFDGQPGLTPVAPTMIEEVHDA